MSFATSMGHPFAAVFGHPVHLHRDHGRPASQPAALDEAPPAPERQDDVTPARLRPQTEAQQWSAAYLFAARINR